MHELNVLLKIEFKRLFKNIQTILNSSSLAITAHFLFYRKKGRGIDI
mgnify:CR=1 FL=1